MQLEGLRWAGLPIGLVPARVEKSRGLAFARWNWFRLFGLEGTSCVRLYVIGLTEATAIIGLRSLLHDGLHFCNVSALQQRVNRIRERRWRRCKMLEVGKLGKRAGSVGTKLCCG